MKSNEKDKAKKKQNKSPVLENLIGVPGALGAAAIGAYGLGRGIASDKEVADYSHAVRMWDPASFVAGNNPGNLSAYMQYATTLSPMAGLRPLGIAPSKVLSGIRSSKDLLELAGIPETYSLLTDVAREGTSGAMHYEAYGKGPLAAYTHQLRNMQNVKVPDSLSTVQGYKLENYPAWMRKLLDGHARSKLIRHLDERYPHLVPGLRHVGEFTPADEITKRLFSVREQESMLKDFMASLSQEQREFILNTEQGHAAGLASQVANYKPLAKGVISTRNTLMDASKTLGGAAGGALAGNLAYRFFRDKNKNKRSKWVEGMATGGGAGLGGLVTYMLATDGGREMLLQAVKRLAGKGAATTKAAVAYGRLSKKASQAAYPGYQGLAVQNFVPVSSRRELTKEDQKLIDEGKSQWIPSLFAAEGDPMTHRMASPWKQSLLAGLATAAAGSVAGGMFANSANGSAYKGALLGGGLGALAGLPAAVLTYFTRDQENRSIEDRMKRLPEGSTTIRDMMSDPVTGMTERSRYQYPNRSNQIAHLALLAALASRR